MLISEIKLRQLVRKIIFEQQDIPDNVDEEFKQFFQIIKKRKKIKETWEFDN